MSSNNPIGTTGFDVTKKDVAEGRRLLNSSMLSDDGRDWLIRAIDPFHDTQIRPKGFPDMDQSGVVVQEVNMSYTVTAPASAGTGNWDCHIFNAVDFASAQGVIPDIPVLLTPWTGLLTGLPGTNVPMQGIVGVAGFPNARLLPDATGCESNNVTYQANPINYIQGKCRVVGWAFEVVNTTAELYRQGLVTVYRMPQIENEILLSQYSTNNTGGNFFSPISALLCDLPPQTVGDALVLPASKQWDAGKGAYCVCTLMNNEYLMQGASTKPRFYADTSVCSTVIGPSLAGLLSPCANMFPTPNFPVYYYAPYNTSGAYFTGLSNQTTLTVNVKYILECAPGPTSPFVTLAGPSPCYDYEAIKLYSHLVSKLPVGVPFEDNPSGEWFEGVLGTLGSLASMASVIHPAFGLVGSGLSIVSKLVPQLRELLGKKPKLVTVESNTKVNNSKPKGRNKPLPPIPKRKPK